MTEEPNCADCGEPYAEHRRAIVSDSTIIWCPGKAIRTYTRPLTGVTEAVIEAGVKELRANLDLSDGLLDELEDDSNLHIALRAAYLAMTNAAQQENAGD
jgi:hypothetical protein